MSSLSTHPVIPVLQNSWKNEFLQLIICFSCLDVINVKKVMHYLFLSYITVVLLMLFLRKIK